MRFVVFLHVTRVGKVFSESVGQSSPRFAGVKLFTKGASYAVDGIAVEFQTDVISKLC